MHIATIQGRAKQSCLTWIGITIVKLLPPPPYDSLQYRATTISTIFLMQTAAAGKNVHFDITEITDVR